jgi:hypothetical protein
MRTARKAAQFQLLLYLLCLQRLEGRIAEGHSFDLADRNDSDFAKAVGAWASA